MQVAQENVNLKKTVLLFSKSCSILGDHSEDDDNSVEMENNQTIILSSESNVERKQKILREGQPEAK